MNNWLISYSSEAELDIISIYEYIAYTLLSPLNAQRQVERVIKAIEGLEQFPYRHELYRDEPWSNMGLRFMTVDNYCVLYLPNEPMNEIDIVRIMYDRRNKSKVLRDE